MNKGGARVRNVDGSRLLRQVVTFVIVLVFTLILLTLLHLASSGIILGREEQREQELMAQVMPNADVFSQVWFEDQRVDDVQAAFRGSALLGYCVTTTTQGFYGPVVAMTGVSADGEVTGVVIVSHGENPRLGGGIAGQDFLSGFVGGSGTLYIGMGHNGVVGVTGATQSSQAVVEGVNIALSCVANLNTGGGDDIDAEV